MCLSTNVKILKNWKKAERTRCHLSKRLPGRTWARQAEWSVERGLQWRLGLSRRRREFLNCRNRSFSPAEKTFRWFIDCSPKPKSTIIGNHQAVSANSKLRHIPRHALRHNRQAFVFVSNTRDRRMSKKLFSTESLRHRPTRESSALARSVGQVFWERRSASASLQFKNLPAGWSAHPSHVRGLPAEFRSRIARTRAHHWTARRFHSGPSEKRRPAKYQKNKVSACANSTTEVRTFIVAFAEKTLRMNNYLNQRQRYAKHDPRKSSIFPILLLAGTDLVEAWTTCEFQVADVEVEKTLFELRKGQAALCNPLFVGFGNFLWTKCIMWPSQKV